MKFIIATGGTGGHFFPALKVAEELRAQSHECVFLGSFTRLRVQSQGQGFIFEELGAKGFVMTWRKEMFVSIIAMIKAFRKAVSYLKKYRPDAVLGFGGYGAFPVVFAALYLKVPALIHEQNVVPGRANALLAKFVKRIAVSFSKSIQYFNSDKTVLTGCPCHTPRENIDRNMILEGFHLDQNLKTILVMGGSQGSRRINEVFVQALEQLKGALDVQVIHVAGKQDYSRLKGRYKEIGIPFALFDFLDKMEEAYHIADLVISRSGAATVSEIAGFQLPAIFIPYPYARGHQRENASVLCETNTTRMIEDQNLCAAKLKEVMLDILNDSAVSDDRSDRVKEICVPDAAQRLAREAIKLKA